MQIDPSATPIDDNYKLLTNLVVPRPIAWITTLSPSGIVNLAPFSFFNAVDSNPIYLAVGVGLRDDGTLTDTARNIDRTGEFVVNLVTENLLDAMNVSAAEFPPDASEVAVTGLHDAPSVKVAAPRLAESEASLECRLYKAERLGRNTLYIGEVVMFHVAEHLIGPRMHINGFAPVGRLGSPSTYCRTTDRFRVPRVSYEQWLEQSAG